MNKQEAIETIEYIDTLTINDRITGQQVDMIIKNQVLDIISQIDEPEKPIIPQFVSEWYISTVEAGLDPLTEFTNAILTMGKHDGRNPRYNYDTGLYKWIKETPNAIQIVVNMHQFGYKVKQPLLYTVEIPNAYHGYLGYSPTFDNFSFYNKQDATEIRFELTEKEIRDFDERFMAFAIPVEEN